MACFRKRFRGNIWTAGQQIGILAAVDATGVELDDEISKRRQLFGFSEIKEARYEHEFK